MTESLNIKVAQIVFIFFFTAFLLFPINCCQQISKYFALFFIHLYDILDYLNSTTNATSWKTLSFSFICLQFKNGLHDFHFKIHISGKFWKKKSALTVHCYHNCWRFKRKVNEERKQNIIFLKFVGTFGF